MDAEQQLERTQKILTRVEHLAEVGGYAVDLETGDVSWTDGMRDIFEVADEFEPTLDNTIAFFHPDDRNAIREEFEQWVETGEGGGITEARFTTAKGNERWMRSEAELTEENGHRILRGFLQDVTKQKERAQQLHETTQQLQAVLDNVEAAVWMRDTDSRFILMNQYFRDLFGIDDDVDVAGKRLSDVLPEEIAEQFRENDRRAIEAGERIEIEEEVEYEHGQMTALTRIMPVYDDGTLYATCGVASDITEQNQREQATQKERDRLDEFASIVSHDLRNPLNVAAGQLELAREECESEHLDRVARAHDRMHALIEDLLTLAREGTRVSETEPVDLHSLTESCWENVETYDATVRIETDRRFRADRSRLTQLLENLFRNAIQHGGQGVTITIGELPNGFYVEDDGPGIPTEDRDDIFDPGYTTSAEGTGFGLSIVKQIADAHGWHLKVTEGTDGGARFEITGVEFVE